MVVAFRVTKDTISPFMKRFPKATKEAISEGIHKIALRGQTLLRDNIDKENLRWTGHLWSATQARKLSGIRSVIFIPHYGIKLDRRKRNVFMPLRYKGGRLRSGSSAVRWFRSAPNSPAKGINPRKIPAGIIVQPHPWIKGPLHQTVKDSEDIMKQEIDKKVK